LQQKIDNGNWGRKRPTGLKRPSLQYLNQRKKQRRSAEAKGSARQASGLFQDGVLSKFRPRFRVVVIVLQASASFRVRALCTINFATVVILRNSMRSSLLCNSSNTREFLFELNRFCARLFPVVYRSGKYPHIPHATANFIPVVGHYNAVVAFGSIAGVPGVNYYSAHFGLPKGLGDFYKTAMRKNGCFQK
jgi:hypothetical protein